MVAEPEVEPTVEVEADNKPEAADEELTFEDLVAKLQNEEFAEMEASAEETAEVAEIDLPDITADDSVEVAVEVAEEGEINLDGIEEAAAEAEETPIDEISFEGLEELFKE